MADFVSDVPVKLEVKREPDFDEGPGHGGDWTQPHSPGQ